MSFASFGVCPQLLLEGESLPAPYSSVSLRGIHYPPFFREEAVIRLRQIWKPRPGDVFVVSHFPIRGLQRLLVSLVEGLNPWDPGLVDKPHFCDAAACKRGAHEYLEEIARWPGRRLFKTHSLPCLFPCVYPFDTKQSDEGLPPPKILVLLADPRNAFSIWAQTLPQIFRGLSFEMGDFLRAVATQEFRLFGDYFTHYLAWAREAEARPDMVRICNADDLGSVDFRQAKQELEAIARFLEVPDSLASRVASSLFQRPATAEQALGGDELVLDDAIHGGHLIETFGTNVHRFHEIMTTCSDEVQHAWRNLLDPWMNSEFPSLQQLAIKVVRSASSLPPLSLTRLMRGPEMHEAGLCKACIFALRGTCKNTAETCLFCHEPGHTNPKRAKRSVRRLRKQRARTPSPDGLSD